MNSGLSSSFDIWFNLRFELWFVLWFDLRFHLRVDLRVNLEFDLSFNTPSYLTSGLTSDSTIDSTVDTECALLTEYLPRRTSGLHFATSILFTSQPTSVWDSFVDPSLHPCYHHRIFFFWNLILKYILSSFIWTLSLALSACQ